MTTTQLTLTSARQLIARGFCRDAAARDRVGRELESGHDPETARFCLVEAVSVVAPDRSELESALAQIARAGDISGNSTDSLLDSLTRWNDEPRRSKRQVVKLLDSAIALA